MKKIAIFGGTFDPIHHAHLIVAREALEQLALDEVIFVPAAVSPYKTGIAHTVADIRVEMVRAAIAGEPGFSLNESEVRRPSPSFTIDTIEEFARANPGQELFYLIGADNLAGLPGWHRIEDLRRLVEFVVLDRGRGAPEVAAYRTIRRPLDISATEIRNRVAKGLSIRYLVPQAVETLIRQHHLYQDIPRSPRKI